MSHDDLILLLQSIQADGKDTKAAVDAGFGKINGRLRKAENSIAVLNFAVFGVGAMSLTFIAYQIAHHLGWV